MIQFDDMKPKGKIFNLFSNNRLVVYKLFKSMESKMDGVMFLRLARTGMIGQVIYDECLEKSGRFSVYRLEQISSLCELYIFYVRSLYDYSLNFLQKKLKGEITSSFHKFVNGVKGNKYPNLTSGFRKLVINSDVTFAELKSLRDSIKNKPSTVRVYSKGDKLYIHANFDSSVIDEELFNFICRHSFNVCYLILFVHLEVEGKTFK